jgi:hypothetical protein
MTRADHVEGGIALRCEPAPVSNGKGFGKAHHAREDMIFPCAYGLFGGVCAMDVRWSALNACLFSGNKGFNIFGCFVVNFMEERFEAADGEPGADLTIGAEKSFFQAKPS